MFTQFKRIAVALATILFLIGAMPTATAQSIFDVQMEDETDSFHKNLALGYFYKSKHDAEIEVFISRQFVGDAWVNDDNEVKFKHTYLYEPYEGGIQEWTCSFTGEYTNIVKYPYTPFYYDYWYIYVSGEVTVTSPGSPDPMTYPASGVIYVFDYAPGYGTDRATGSIYGAVHCGYSDYAIVNVQY